MRPVSSRSGRLLAKLASIRKYSCSAPQLEFNVSIWVSPISVRTRLAARSMAAFDRNSGIFLSSDSPVHDMNTLGIISVDPLAVCIT